MVISPAFLKTSIRLRDERFFACRRVSEGATMAIKKASLLCTYLNHGYYSFLKSDRCLSCNRLYLDSWL